MKKTDRKLDKKGSALAFILIVVFVVTLIVFSIAALSSQNMRNVAGKYWEDRARFGALAGVQRALTELDQDNAWDAGFLDEPLEGDPEVTYSVQVFNQMDQLGAFAPDGKTWVPPDAVWIHSVASLADRKSAGVASMVSVVGPQRPVFNHALFAVNEALLIETQTIPWHPGGVGDGDAWIGSNSTDANAVTLQSNSFVDGDIITGVDPTGSTAVLSMDGSSGMFGAHKIAEETNLVTEFVSPIEYFRVPSHIPPGPGAPPPLNNTNFGAPPTWVDPTWIDVNPSSGNSRLSLPRGGPYGTIDFDGPIEVQLTEGGVYYFQGSIDMRNFAQMYVDTTNVSSENPAIIYLDQKLIVRDGAQVNWDNGANLPDEPRQFQVYCTGRLDPSEDPEGTPQEAFFVNTTQVSMMYGGEESDVYFHDAALYGGIIADRVESRNSQIFYDTRNRGVKMNGQGEISVISTTLESSAQASQALASDTTTNPAAPAPPAPPPATTAPPPAPPPGVNNPPAPPPAPGPPPGNANPPAAPPPSVP